MDVKFEVLTAVLMRIQVFWDVTKCVHAKTVKPQLYIPTISIFHDFTNFLYSMVKNSHNNISEILHFPRY